MIRNMCLSHTCKEINFRRVFSKCYTITFYSLLSQLWLCILHTHMCDSNCSNFVVIQKLQTILLIHWMKNPQICNEFTFEAWSYGSTLLVYVIFTFLFKQSH